MGELPVITAAEWESLGAGLVRHPGTLVLKAKRHDMAPAGYVPLLFTGTGTNAEEWAFLFDAPADELQQVPTIRTPATEHER